MLSSDDTSEEQLEEVMKEVEAEEAEEDAKEQQAVAWLQSREEKKMAIQVGLSSHHLIWFQGNCHTGCFFNWYPPKKLKYGKPRLGESTLT